MPLRLTAADWRAMLPRAPQPVIDAYASPSGAAVLDRAGITHTRTRLAYAMANVEHECGGYTIPHLTENINYTAERMAVVFKNRVGSAGNVRAKYGTAPGWQKKAFDDLYGNRMGNRPGTHDGSTFIGRAGPQITGRDGYAEVGKRSGRDLVANPEAASSFELQPDVLAAFWTWKNMNRFADAADFRGAVKSWNGGTNGMADREVQLKGNDPIIARLKAVDSVKPVANAVPGGPPTKDPPKAVIDDATEDQRRNAKNAGKAGGTATAAGAANETVKGTTQPDKAPPLLPSLLAYTAIGIGLMVVVVFVAILIKRRGKVFQTWTGPVQV